MNKCLVVFAAVLVLIAPSCMGNGKAAAAKKPQPTASTADPLMDSINKALIGNWTLASMEQRPKHIPAAGERLFAASPHLIEFTRKKRCRLLRTGQAPKETAFFATRSTIVFGPDGCTGTIEQRYQLKDSVLTFVIKDWNGQPCTIVYFRE